MKIEGEHWYWSRPSQRKKHGLVDRRIADAIAGGRRVWVYIVPEGKVRAGTVEIVGYSVELGMWVMVVLVGGNLLFNGFTLKRNDEDEVREFMKKITGMGR